MIPAQNEVDRGGPGPLISSPPLFQGVTPETPKLRSVRGDLKPMMTNEEEVVGALPQSAKVWVISIRNDVPTKDEPEDFRGYARGDVQ